jgi:hypothetical protein
VSGTSRARYLGADAALTAASWIVMSESDARSILSDVDPMVLDSYPEPNLSGGWADDLTPAILYREVTGVTVALATAEQVDEIADAWEEGRDAVWSDALRAHALRLLGDIPRALEVERATEAYVSSLRAASER